MKKCLLFLFVFSVINVNRIAAQVAVNNDGSVPDSSAMLDVSAKALGMLIPRVSLLNSEDDVTIPNPATALLVFNTGDKGLSPAGFYYNAGIPSSPSWHRLSSVSAGQDVWLTTGNTGTLSGTNFIGTKDNQAFDLRTNDTAHLRLTTKGQLVFLNTGESVFIGEGAGYSDDHTTNRNVFVGLHAGRVTSTGLRNTAIGSISLYANSSGSYNTAVGDEALWSNVAGSNATAIGTSAMQYSNNQSTAFDNENVAVGYEALRGSTNPAADTGNYNTAVGYQSLSADNSGSSNTAIGSNALFSNTDGNLNTATGKSALYSLTSGGQNTANGAYALFSDTTGGNNTAVGYLALYSNTEGGVNVAIGTEALYNNTSGTLNTACGYLSLYNNLTSDYNTASGGFSLYSNTTGSNNTAIGHSALYSNTTGDYNVAVGKGALYSNNDIQNTAIGDSSLFSNTIGFGNTACGDNALFSNVNGFYCTALGYHALSISSNRTNATAIGATAAITVDNSVRLGNAVVSSIGGYANWSNVSDRRFKTNIHEDVVGLEFIMNLRPVTYHLDMDAINSFNHTPDNLRLKEGERLKAAEIQSGFIAQEVEAAAREVGYDFHGVDKPKNENTPYGLRYAEFVVPIVKAIQEQQQMILHQHTINEELRSENAALKARLDRLEAMMDK